MLAVPDHGGLHHLGTGRLGLVRTVSGGNSPGRALREGPCWRSRIMVACTTWGRVGSVQYRLSQCQWGEVGHPGQSREKVRADGPGSWWPAPPGDGKVTVSVCVCGGGDIAGVEH